MFKVSDEHKLDDLVMDIHRDYFRCNLEKPTLIPLIEYMIDQFRKSSKCIPISCIRLPNKQVLGTSAHDPLPTHIQVNRSSAIGEGNYGGIFSLQDDPQTVAKIMPFFHAQKPKSFDTKYYINHFLGEVGIAIYAGNCGIGAKVKGFFLCFDDKESNHDVPESKNPTLEPAARPFQSQYAKIPTLFPELNIPFFSKPPPPCVDVMTASQLYGTILMERYDGDMTRYIPHPYDLVQIILKIQHMHKVGILHLDLFPKNILYRIREDPQTHQDVASFAITDFSLSVPWNVQQLGPIPPELRAIDYITLAQYLVYPPPEYKFNPTDFVMRNCIQDNGMEATQKAFRWLENRYETCQGEYALLEVLPYYLYMWYGPALTINLAWSTRCKDEHSQRIHQALMTQVQRVERDPWAQKLARYEELVPVPLDEIASIPGIEEELVTDNVRVRKRKTRRIHPKKNKKEKKKNKKNKKKKGRKKSFGAPHTNYVLSPRWEEENYTMSGR